MAGSAKPAPQSYVGAYRPSTEFENSGFFGASVPIRRDPQCLGCTGDRASWVLGGGDAARVGSCAARDCRRLGRFGRLVAAAGRFAAAGLAAARFAARDFAAARLLVLGHQPSEEITQRTLLRARVAARNGLAAGRFAARNRLAANGFGLAARGLGLATGRLATRVDVAASDVAAAGSASAVQLREQAERVGVRGAAAEQQDGRGGCRQHVLTNHRETPTHPETNVCTILAPLALERLGRLAALFSETTFAWPRRNSDLRFPRSLSSTRSLTLDHTFPFCSISLLAQFRLCSQYGIVAHFAHSPAVLRIAMTTKGRLQGIVRTAPVAWVARNVQRGSYC